MIGSRREHPGSASLLQLSQVDTVIEMAVGQKDHPQVFPTAIQSMESALDSANGAEESAVDQIHTLPVVEEMAVHHPGANFDPTFAGAFQVAGGYRGG